MPIQVLILDDEKIVGSRLKESLEERGYHAENFTQPVMALNRIKEKLFDIVVTDIRMHTLDGIQILEEVRKKSTHTKVIMMTAYASLETARETLTKGAFDFIAKPFQLNEMMTAIKKAEAALQTPHQ